MTIVIDRNRASQFGISPANGLDGHAVRTLSASGRSQPFHQISIQYRVVLEVAPEHKLGRRIRFKDIYVPSADGKQIPLSIFARFRR